MTFTIHGKEVILLGDTTTHGGKVVTASAGASYMGIPIARVGDSVTCPKCKGTHTIVEGAPTAFDVGQQIACHGDKVSCGATLVSRNGKSASMGIYHGLTDPEAPIPTKGLSAEEICAKIADVMASADVQRAIQEAWENTQKNGYEYGFWIVESPEGVYTVPKIATSEQRYDIFVPGRPQGRVAFFHTHTEDSSFPSFSDFDRRGAADAATHPVIFNMVMNEDGITFMNDEGKNVVCDGENGPRICEDGGDRADPKDPRCW